MRVFDLRMPTTMLALGIILGAGATIVSRQPSVVFAQEPMGNTKMGMGSKSAGDAEMNAAMARMMQSMSTAPMTGVQDRDFMTMMIPHHRSAVDMAKIELRRGQRPELKALARDIIASQDREIVQMRAWLKVWYDPRS